MESFVETIGAILKAKTWIDSSLQMVIQSALWGSLRLNRWELLWMRILANRTLKSRISLSFFLISTLTQDKEIYLRTRHSRLIWKTWAKLETSQPCCTTWVSTSTWITANLEMKSTRRTVHDWVCSGSFSCITPIQLNQVAGAILSFTMTRPSSLKN